MGKDLKEGSANGSGKTQQKGTKGAKRRSPIFTFNPSREERASAKERAGVSPMVVDRLARLVAGGVKITVGYSPDRDSYFVIAREEGENWLECAALSAWHKDVWLALAALTVAVDGRFEGFPDCTIPAGVVEDDW